MTRAVRGHQDWLVSQGARIVALYESGLSAGALAERFQTTSSNMTKLLHQLGARLRGRGEAQRRSLARQEDW